MLIRHPFVEAPVNNTVLALIVGLIAGAAGAFVPTLLTSGDDGALTAESSADLRPILERLDRIETMLENPPRTASLRGLSGDGATLPGSAGADGEITVDALLARLDERMRQTVKESMKDTWAELGASSGAAEAVEIPEPEKKRVTLADAARELELSGQEEAELRRIHEETFEKALELIASEEDGGVDQVRRELEEAKTDPAKRMGLVGKYMGRVLGNIGGFIMLGQEHDQKIVKAIGKDKARRLENEYELTDVDPYDLESMLSGGFGD